ncbi:MAG: sulfotransferase [Thioalkalispiraceae bacterium]|jgi:tetratricopeptide (TPR) repeat protein
MFPASQSELEQGIKHLDLANYLEAEECFKRVLNIEPDNYKAIHMLGVIALRNSMPDVAAELIEEALKINRNDETLFADLGMAYQEMGLYEKSQDIYHQGLAVNKDSVELNHRLGFCFYHLNDNQKAIEYISRALEIEPENVDAQSDLAVVLLKINDLDRALDILDKLIASHPGETRNYLTLAELFMKKSHYDFAKNAYLAALQIDDNFQPAILRLGLLLQKTGDKENAKLYLYKVLENDPLSIPAIASLIKMKDENIDEVVYEIEKLLDNSDENFTNSQKKDLYFLLGEFHEKKKGYDKAFEYFKKANELKKSNYNKQEHEKLIADIKSVFSEIFFEQRKGFGSLSDKPIFVVGMPRSGTTLVETILSSHPAVYGAGELDQIKTLALTAPQAFNIDNVFPSVIPELDEKHAKMLAELYLRYIREFGAEEHYITDKMPTNFWFLGLIALLFPNAHVIHVKRNPIDTALSCYSIDFLGNHPWSYKLEDIIHFYRQYESLMEHWRQVLPVNFHEISYEDIIENQEQETRRLLEYCNLEWDDKCLSFYNAKRAVSTASIDQVRQPIYRSSLQKWKNYDKHINVLKQAFL